MKNTSFFILLGIAMAGCSKTSPSTASLTVAEITITEKYDQYNISRGNHYCDESTIKAINFSEQVFNVKFDSTAIYKTIVPLNQYDVNKLYGFSEGMDPHVNSARIGWAYLDDTLRLYAYSYKEGVRETQEISPVLIGNVINCSIKLENKSYIFSVNGKKVRLDRSSDVPIATGYQLYPYFGGLESAPHKISIFIKELTPVK
ncbi:MAG: hypothetical protein ABIP80_02860 [Ferruginibacter sp.]